MKTASSILKQYWGYNSFRPLQENIIDCVNAGKDVLALLPTGGGKSICFQVPALMKEGICLVISPLIALINDQVDNLNNKGINAVAIHSGLSHQEVKKEFEYAAKGYYKFIYLSPERLATKLFLEYLPALSPSLIAIDEAHCISQWGYDFRPAYLKIAPIREQLPEVPIIALTASATKEVQQDICDKLEFKKGFRTFKQSFERPNISYHVIEPVSRTNTLLELLRNNNGTAIVYGSSRKQTEATAAMLKLHGLDADFYHAGLTKEERSSKQDNWINDKLRIIVCTNAFGMGIDKPDVRTVIHYMIPESIENYYQEAGRAGRDGKPSNVYLIYEKKDAEVLRKTNELRYPEPEVLKKIYTALMNHLQVAAGSGEGQSFDFDITTFSSSFKLNLLQVGYALQTMAQEGLFFISESAFKFSKAVFTCTKEELRNLDINYPGAAEMSRALLRSYEGIFDHPTSIFEKQLGAFMKVPLEQVVKQLQFLNRISIIHYTQQSDKPKITLLHNRMYSDAYHFDNASVKKRKEKHLSRINAVINYAENRLQCRSKMIAQYFDDDSCRPCGQCDNCKKVPSEKTDKDQFKLIADKIISYLKGTEKTSVELLSLFKDDEILHVKHIIRHLLNEEIIISTGSGKLSANAKKDE